MRPTSAAILPLLLAATTIQPTYAQPQGTIGQYSDATVEGSVLEPKPITVADDAELAGLIKVPDGFAVEVVGRELGNTRMLAIHGSTSTLHGAPRAT